MKIDIKIQSISDIITNSSSEVYLQTYHDCVERLKDIIDALAGDGFSNNFEIEDLGGVIQVKAKKPEFEGYAIILDDNINNLFYASN